MKLEPSRPVDVPQFVQKSKKKSISNWFSWLIALVLLGSIGYIIYRQAVIVPRQEARRSVVLAPVVRESLPVTVSANGTVNPERLINLSPKTAGVLKRLLVKEGDTVKSGQIIAYMDDSNLQGQLTQARGQLAQAEANLQKLIAGNRPQDIAQAQAQLQEAQANLQRLIAGNRPQDISQAQARLQQAQATLTQAEDDFRRNQELYRAGAISLQTLNQELADRDTAQAQVAEAREALALQQAGARSEDIEQARAVVQQRQQALELLQAGTRSEDIEQARAQVVSAQGSLQTIQAQINDTIIRAPFDGLVTKKFADPGAFVTPTTAGSEVSSATSSSILSLASTNQVVANVAESNIARIRLGQKVTIKADAYPGKVFEGEVSQIAAQATVAQNVTSFEVEVAIVSDAQNLLRVGMNAEEDFQVGRLENALLIPTVAVVRQENMTGVWVATADDPIFVTIETGVTVNDKTEVRSGLKGGEQILLSFPPGVRESSARRLFPGSSSDRSPSNSSPTPSR